MVEPGRIKKVSLKMKDAAFTKPLIMQIISSNQ